MNTLAIIAAMTFGQLGIVPEQPNGLRVVVFSAEWCQPCKELHAEIERDLLSNRALGWRERIQFEDVETSEQSKHAARNGQGGYDVPQVVLIDGEEVVFRFKKRPTAVLISRVYNAIFLTR